MKKRILSIVLAICLVLSLVPALVFAEKTGNVRIKECKSMIQALHNAGISVVMDVVYNHTYSTDSCF